jgi:hypothetical protein
MTLLKIDLDLQPPEDWLKLWMETRIEMLKYLGYTPVEWRTFKTKRGVHIYIRIVEKIPDMEANKLQFLCGDDPTRVKINIWRIKRGIPYWNKLFAEVLYRKKRKTVTCWYCGNKIPVE